MLVVEDDPISASAMSKILSRRGWQVTVAHSLAEGLEKVPAEPDWLILDLMLPDGGGEAILSQIRHAGLSTRVAVTTAVSDPARLEELRRLKPDSVFPKPLDLPRLLDFLEGRADA